ncbi:MAG: SMI1/KNR4 family protein [Oscillospiraceae bacterium]
MDIKAIENMKNFCSLKGTSEEKIIDAENSLGVTFSEEYKSYLNQYALASMNGHELTGIVDSKRLNVVDVTIKHREINPDIPKNLYVLEELNIDDVVAWQDENGLVFQTIGTSEPVKICDSLVEYVK